MSMLSHQLAPSLLRKVNYNLAEGLLDLVEDLREAIDCPYSMLDIEGRYGVEFKDLGPATRELAS